MSGSKRQAEAPPAETAPLQGSSPPQKVLKTTLTLCALSAEFQKSNYFKAVAKLLSSSKQIQDISSIIKEIHALSDGTIPPPFLVVDCPSGSGKTQLVFSLKELEGALFAKVVHVVASNSTSQQVYRDIGQHTKYFAKAVGEDFDTFCHVFDDVPEIPNTSLISKRSSKSKSKLLALLAGDGSSYPADGMSIAEFRAQSRRESPLPFVFYIDEVAKDNDGAVTTRVLLARNLARAAGIVVALAGTSSKAVNMVQTAGSASDTGTACPWAFAVTRLPPLLLAAVQERLSNHTSTMQRMIQQAVDSGKGNPRLILSALNALEKSPLNMQEWLATFTEDSWQRKHQHLAGSSGWVLGALAAELNLLLDGSMDGATADASIAHHYARRVLPTEDGGVGFWLGLVNEGFDSYDAPLVRLDSDKNILPGVWDLSKFPTVDEDPLVHVAFLRHNGQRLGKRTTLDAITAVYRSSSLMLDNPAAISSTGNLLEYGIVAALRVANGAAFMSSMHNTPLDVVHRLLQELNLKRTLPNDESDLANMKDSQPLFVGRLADGKDVSATRLAGTCLGFMRRTANNEEIDAIVEVEASLAGAVEWVLETKDWLTAVSKAVVERVYKKLEKAQSSGQVPGRKRIGVLVSRNGFPSKLPAVHRDSTSEIWLASRHEIKRVTANDIEETRSGSDRLKEAPCLTTLSVLLLVNLSQQMPHGEGSLRTAV